MTRVRLALTCTALTGLVADTAAATPVFTCAGGTPRGTTLLTVDAAGGYEVGVGGVPWLTGGQVAARLGQGAVGWHSSADGSLQLVAGAGATNGSGGALGPPPISQCVLVMLLLPTVTTLPGSHELSGGGGTRI